MYHMFSPNMYQAFSPNTYRPFSPIMLHLFSPKMHQSGGGAPHSRACSGSLSFGKGTKDAGQVDDSLFACRPPTSRSLTRSLMHSIGRKRRP